MIRVNLLPQAKKAARGAASASRSAVGPWILGYTATAAVFSVLLGILYFATSAELEEKVQRNAALEQRITALKQRSTKLEEVKAALAKSNQLEALVAELNKARTGPARLFMELSNILSAGKGPSLDPEELERLRRDNPLAGFNRGWDVRRLWVMGFDETGGQCRLRGRGKSNEDVAEFLRRMVLSELFEQVTLQRTQAITDDETKLPMIDFEVTCKVRY